MSVMFENCISQDVQDKILRFVCTSQDFKLLVAKKARIKSENIEQISVFSLDWEGVLGGPIIVSTPNRYVRKILRFHARFCPKTGELLDLEIDK